MYRLKKILALILSLIIFVIPVASCSDDEDENVLQADYGSYGAMVARELASLYPYRRAYTDQEAQAGEYIRSQFESLGYDVSKQDFTSLYGGSSANYIVNIPGNGFFSFDDLPLLASQELTVMLKQTAISVMNIFFIISIKVYIISFYSNISESVFPNHPFSFISFKDIFTSG